MSKDLKPDGRHPLRKLGGALAVVAGVGLIALEVSGLSRGESRGVAWFWIVIAALLVLLGIAELLDFRQDRS